ncbi:MAG: hypothetical protein AAB110_03130 [Candidatus Desantisbacteria bacterium]
MQKWKSAGCIQNLPPVSQPTFLWIIIVLVPIWAIRGERFLYTAAAGFSILIGVILLEYVVSQFDPQINRVSANFHLFF